MKSSLPDRRIVITGMGVVAPNGSDLATFWSSIRSGPTATGLVSKFDVSKLPSRLAAEIKDFDASKYMDRRKARRFDHSTQYGMAASLMALQDSGLDLSSLEPDRVGLVEGTSVSGMESTFKGQTAFEGRGYRSMSPFTLINAYSGGGSGEIAIELGIRGHAVTYSSGSASGNDAIGYARATIASNEADVVIAGGTEAPILAPLYGAFCLTRVMSQQNEAPAQAMKPFDQRRDGFVLGEGAAFLVLEELSHALSRNARIYGEVSGHARACEAFHSVAPHPNGDGMYRAIERALRNAELDLSQIDYVNAHGTATPENDRVESIALRRFFGVHARNLGVSSTKSVTGHLLAAAGAIETVVCALAVYHREMPPTFNHSIPGEDCTLDYISEGARPYPIRHSLNLNVGFGGKNSCLVISAYPGR